MVNEFVLDDLSSSWTDSFYKNKTNSFEMKVAPGVYSVYIYISKLRLIYIYTYIFESCASFTLLSFALEQIQKLFLDHSWGRNL